MRRFLAIVVLCGAVVTAAAAVAGASPVSGGAHVQFSMADAVTTNFLDGPVDGPSSFLPDAACGFSPAAGTERLTADVHGWQGPFVDELLQNRVVSLNANVDGTIADVAGNRYHVSGVFSQDGLTTFPQSSVPFDGVGRLTISGPGGSINGDAAFRVVQDFPLEWDFWFTSIKTCNVR
jgi:hypothetical protein